MLYRGQAYCGFGVCSGAAEGSAPGPGAPAGPAELFTTSFSSLLGLKYGIFLAGTSTRAPVFGLRPTRDCLWRVRKLPNPRISILSPPRSERTILSKIASTMTSDSFRVISTTRETSSIRSAFVIVHLTLRFCQIPQDEAIRDFALSVALLLPAARKIILEARTRRHGFFLVFVQPAALFLIHERLQ